ncbi:MAG: hypothetical protein ACK4YM_09310, partial [Novosphingobium sp.]
MNPRNLALTALAAAPSSDPATLLRAASAALEHGAAAEVEATLSAAVARLPSDPRIWQFLGLARRDLQDSAGAHDAFTRAAALAPNDPLIAHGLARSALEAGYPALPLFNRARLLAPGDGSVALGRAASQFAEGRGEDACDQLAAMLVTNPGWIDGHIALARFLAQVRPGAPLDDSLRAALRQHPRAGALWQARMRVLMEARDYAATLAVVDEARAALGPADELDRIAALCLTELGRAEEAQVLFDRLPFPADPEQAIWPIRNYIRLGRHDQALTLAEYHFDGQSPAPLWPYRSLLWRLLGDPRWGWLEGDARLVGTYDIAAEVGPLEDLAAVLRSLHAAKGQPLDQSVRGGTQTDGNLLARAEPEIRRLRAALLEAVRHYVAQLPPPDRAHPMLLDRRDDLRVAGAWSVRLTDHGFHADHVHYQGWISSAFYVVV